MTHNPKIISTEEAKQRIDAVMRAMRARRVEIGVTIASLSNQMGYDEKTIKNWEAGRHYPRFRAMKDWCDALGVELTLKEK